MIVYGTPLSPFVRKVLIYGEERALGLELKPTMIGADDPDFWSISPFRKIPALRDGDFAISDSSAIIAYLEAKLPEGKLGASSAEDIARTVWFEEFVDTIAFAAAVPIFFNRIVAPRMGRPQKLEAAERAQADTLPPVLAYLEQQIRGVDTPLVGNRFGIADIAVGSLLTNLTHCDAAPDVTRYPGLSSWMSVVHNRPSFAKWIAIERKMLAPALAKA